MATPSAPPRAAVDPRKADKAQRLRAEGEEAERKDQLKKAVEKYGESIELVPDPEITQRIARLTPLADQQEREKKAKQLRQIAKGFEGLGWLDQAAKKYRESLTYVPDPELEAYVVRLEAAAARKARDRAQEQEREERERQDAARRPTPLPPQPAARPATAPSRPVPPAPAPPAPRSQPPSGPAACLVTGVWASPNGGLTFTLRQEGERVTGKKESPFGDQIVSETVQGTFSGQTLRLSWETPIINLVHDNSLTGAMSGDCSSMRVSSTWRRRVDGLSGNADYVLNRR